MKIFFTILILFPSSLFAQSWFPDEAVWHYDVPSIFGEQGYVRIAVNGDTLINNQPCRELIKIKESAFPGYEPVTTPLGSFYMYDENGLVLAYDPATSSFDTLYDMNAVPGDRWQQLFLPGPTCDPPSEVLVIDTGTVTIDGADLRWLAVEVDHYLEDSISWIVPDTIIERIGTVSNYMINYHPCAGGLDWYEGGQFRCYSDSQIDHMADENIPCDMVVGIGEEHYDRTDLRIWPNPGSDDLNISWEPSNSTSVRIEIHSMLGELLRSEKAVVSPITITTHDLPAGCYSIHIIDSEQRSAVKWLKL